MSNFFQSQSILAHPFRPFFLLTGIYGVITVIVWMSFLYGGLSLPLGWSPVHWHSHEMLFGLIPMAIAGFLLTAVCNWTGATPLQGIALLALIIIWFAGRVAMWTASWWPVGIAAAVDLLFMPMMAIYMTRVLLRHGNKRNLPIAAILLLLSLANVMMHIGFITSDPLWLRRGELMSLGLITLMMIVIGGRIIPLFTINWLRNQGIQSECVKSFAVLDRAALIATLLLVPADFFTGTSWLTGVMALIAGALNALRLIGWSGWRTAGEPLLWILHLGYGWIVVALLLKSAAAFNLAAPTAWQHALGVGAMGALILGVMTRVALGHTGRTLTLPRFAIAIYVAITLAALARVLAALQLLDYRIGLLVAATGWSLAFATFTLIYWPILTRPRADGRPG
ncbi:NnrS family protein [Cellvibrio sp. KY-GH-1]|uniref:NnrS family protein n=1 Tax=Cellvibrio sp. KY-GH-1 TaxID=2303332 RepID=UPI0012456DD6|nr:NnrS family protein [Cellvibrio sp. KY-GH-1]QEY15294.1 NnrS family protein [Cellvibrio sp. KY-GH-1]